MGACALFPHCRTPPHCRKPRQAGRQRDPKRLGLVHELVPKAVRVAVLDDPALGGAEKPYFGGLSMEGSRWVVFFLPVRVLSKLFRRLMLEHIAAAHAAGKLIFFGAQAHLADARGFAAFLAPLRKIRWFVYAKRPFAGPKAPPA
jgi:Putative transposase